PVSAPPRPPNAVNDDALYERVASVFEEQVNPMVARHGGRVELIDVQDAVVMLRMGGGCQGCGMADVTLRQGIEGLLAQAVASERPSALEESNPAGLLTLDFEQPERAADAVHVFAKQYPISGVVAVDDATAVIAAAITTRLQLKGNPVHAAIAASDKYLQRE